MNFFLGTIFAYTLNIERKKFQEKTSMLFKLSDQLTLQLKHGEAAFSYFSAKTNRLALFSVTLFHLEINLHKQRQWLLD